MIFVHIITLGYCFSLYGYHNITYDTLYLASNTVIHDHTNQSYYCLLIVYNMKPMFNHHYKKKFVTLNHSELGNAKSYFCVRHFFWSTSLNYKNPLSIERNRSLQKNLIRKSDQEK